MAPSHSALASGSGAGHRAAGEAADQQRRKPHAFDDRRVGALVVAERQHERRGHGAGQRIAQLVEHDEDQHGDGRVARQEIGEGMPSRAKHARQRVGLRRGFGRAGMSGSRASSTASSPTATSAAATA